MNNIDIVNRLEIIDSEGRNYVRYNIHIREISIQDKGRTMKVFIE